MIDGPLSRPAGEQRGIRHAELKATITYENDSYRETREKRVVKVLQRCLQEEILNVSCRPLDDHVRAGRDPWSHVTVDST